MTGIRYKNNIDIPNVIAPQNILVDDKKIYVFDKINIDEGRLYCFDNTFSNRQMIVEVDDGECFFGRDGLIYILDIDDNSTVEVYDFEGNKIKELVLVGTTYFLDVDSSGNIYAIFVDDDGMAIRMYDSNGKYIRSMHSRNMPLLSNLYCDGEYIYTSGLSQDTPPRIEKINYLSYIIDTYSLDSKDSKFIITKILKYGSIIIAVLSGDGKDTIVLIDEADGDIREISLTDVDIYFVHDISIKNGELFVLGNDRRAAVYDLVEDKDKCCKSSDSIKKKVFNKSSYGYLSYLIYMKNFSKDFISLFIKAAIPLTMLAMFVLQVGFKTGGVEFSTLENVRIFVVLSSLLAILSIVIKNVAITFRKRLRLDNLLDLYNRVDTINKVICKNSVLTGIVMLIIVFFILYKNEVSDFVSCSVSILSGTVSGATVYYNSIKLLARFKKEMDNMVFELLSFKLEDDELLRKIATEVRVLRKQGTERYRIKVRLKNKLGKDIVKLIKRWSNSRKKIIGDTGSLKNKNEYLIFDLNLKNRDIKYSRISVIEDFICYIINGINKSSVMIEALDDDEVRI